MGDPNIPDILRAKAAARAIVSCHETAPPTPRPDYAEFAVLKDGAGISYGAHQGTDRSDALDKIVKIYCDNGGAHAAELRTYLPLLAQNTPSSIAAAARDRRLQALLVDAAQEQVMRDAQNLVFDRDYMEPALRAMTGSGWVEPLTLAVIYDSLIQGSWARLRDRVRAEASERGWIEAYVELRRFHMQNASNRKLSIWANPILRRTVYRMDTFRGLIRDNNWRLETPFKAHGVTVSEEDLDYPR